MASTAAALLVVLACTPAALGGPLRLLEDGPWTGPPPPSPCPDWFSDHGDELEACNTALARSAAVNATTCPNACRGIFDEMPRQCSRAVKATLPPGAYPDERAQGGRPFDVCETVVCGNGAQCSVTIAVLAILRPVFQLADKYPPQLDAKPPKTSGGSKGLSAGAIAGIIVGDLALVTVMVAGILVLLRHRRRRTRQAQLQLAAPPARPAPPPPAPGDSGKLGGYPSSALASEWDERPLDIDSAGAGGAKPEEAPGAMAITVAAGAGALPPGPPPPFLQPASAGASLSPPNARAATPDGGNQRLAALWAGAAEAAAGTPALAGAASSDAASVAPQPDREVLAEDPLLLWLNNGGAQQPDAAQQQQRQQQDSGASDASGSGTSGAGSGGSPARRGSGASSPGLKPLASRMASRRSSSSMVDLAPWEVQWRDLTILRPLGEGSWGRVYLASWNQTQCALKMLLNADEAAAAARSGESVLSLSSPVMLALQKECGMMASLRHPNVVLFLGVCYSPPAIVTEFCQRGSLFDVLRTASTSAQAAASLSWARRLSMALDAAKGMLALHAHSPPIIHRDLKSPNLLVDAAWRVKVCDFNLSRLLEDTGGRSSSVAGMLNPRWLAPEVLTGGSATAASDVFSFGVVMWELMVWQLPWAQQNPFQLVFGISSGERLAVPAREGVAGAAPPPELYAAYVALMQRCWAQQPSERPSFADVITELSAMRPLAGAAAAAASQPA